MKQDRSLLEHNLIKPTMNIKRKRNVVKDIKNYLAEKHDIFEGSVQSWINDPKKLQGVDTRLLYLFTEQIFQKTGDLSINPDDYFTESEIRTARQYSGKMHLTDEIKFPIVFENALQVSRDSWIILMDAKTIVGLLKSRKLHWNPESQREATYKVIDGQIVEVATFYMHNVYEMVDLLKQNKLERTQLTLNCSLGTAHDGEEVTYDELTGRLTIHDGTKIDIVDGAHRIKALEIAMMENPEIKFSFVVKLLNFTVPRAAEYLAQISKGERISETKRKIMSKETEADIVATDLMNKSVLRDRVSKKEMLTKSRKELVTYNTLTSSIEKNFDLSKKVFVYNTTDYLIEFFEALFSYYEEAFVTEYDKYKEESIINDNNMFAGYVLLASRMKKSNTEARQVYNFMKDIDFNRNNKLWVEKEILDEKGNLTKNAKHNIEKFFSEIDINK